MLFSPYAIEHLKNNGRYLNSAYEIVNGAGAIPSQKWIIFLTDENMDNDNLPAGYNSSNVITKLSKELKENGVELTGIFHTKQEKKEVYNGLKW